MSRVLLLGSLLVVMLIGVPGFNPVAVVGAQDATPAADQQMGGLTFEPLGFASGVTLATPADLDVVRIRFAPGAGFPAEASDPSAAMVVVESGTLTVRINEVDWTVTRGAALQAAMAGGDDPSTASETIAAGTDATLEAGDFAFVPGSTSGGARNDGTVEAVVLLFGIGPAMSMADATPAP